MATTWLEALSNGSSILNFCCPSFNWTQKALSSFGATGTGFWRREGQRANWNDAFKTQTWLQFHHSGKTGSFHIPRSVPSDVMITHLSALGACFGPTLGIKVSGSILPPLPFENPIQMNIRSSEWTSVLRNATSALRTGHPWVPIVDTCFTS